MMHQLLRYDCLDDRREVHRLLQLLHPRQAVAWLDRQCQRAAHPHGSRPAPARKMEPRVREAELKGGQHHYRLCTELFFDFWTLASQYGIDMDVAVRELEELVQCRHRSASPSFALRAL
jgi:hypothetical protein